LLREPLGFQIELDEVRGPVDVCVELRIQRYLQPAALPGAPKSRMRRDRLAADPFRESLPALLIVGDLLGVGYIL
jgi:hypothetical protein